MSILLLSQGVVWMYDLFIFESKILQTYAVSISPKIFIQLNAE